MAIVLPAIAVSPKPLIDVWTKIFAKQNTAPCTADEMPVFNQQNGFRSRNRMTLLERSKSGIRLTSAGEQLLPFLRKALSGYDELEGQILRMKGLETGIVRIGTFSSVAINWLPNVFSEMQHDYPGIEYEILLGDYDDVKHWIGDGRVDCGFLPLSAADDFDTISLMRDEYRVVLPTGHPFVEKVNDLYKTAAHSTLYFENPNT